jgi:hypothetical protein
MSKGCFVRQKGERWRLRDGREVIVIQDFPETDLTRCLNQNGKLEIVGNNQFDEWLNVLDFPNRDRRKEPR